MRVGILLMAVVIAGGCSDDDDTGADTNLDPAADLSLMTTDGAMISAEDLACIYRQDTGASTSLSLQLQYLDSPDSVAFALYLTDPVPAAPFAAAAGQQGGFEFEVFTEDTGYGDTLFEDEIEIRLNDLPSPAELADGDVISLRGSVLINSLSLPETSATGETGSKVLALASDRVDIDCQTTFQRVDVVN